MSYWSTAPDGTSFAGDGSLMWGDYPADIFANAIEDVIRVFGEDLGRKPTTAELRAGFEFHVKGMAPQPRTSWPTTP